MMLMMTDPHAVTCGGSNTSIWYKAYGDKRLLTDSNVLLMMMYIKPCEPVVDLRVFHGGYRPRQFESRPTQVDSFAHVAELVYSYCRKLATE